MYIYEIYYIIRTLKKGVRNEQLDIKRLLEERQVLKIGKLNENIINMLGLQINNKNIKIGYDRISHCEKHKKDFISEQSYNKSMEAIPLIIQQPDYVGYNHKNDGIEYIKRIDELTLVAVRLKQNGDLYFKSIYPISEVKLKNKILSKEYKKL